MTKKEFSAVAKMLKVVWKKDFLTDEVELEVWSRALADLPYEAVKAAVTTYIMTKKFEPKPADIREIAAGLLYKAAKPNELTAAEAFTLYWDAICDGNWHARERFDSLPEVVQRIAGSPSNISAMACDPNTNREVEKALFEKRYDAEMRRARDEISLPGKIREMLAGIGGQPQAIGTGF